MTLTRCPKCKNLIALSMAKRGLCPYCRPEQYRKVLIMLGKQRLLEGS